MPPQEIARPLLRRLRPDRSDALALLLLALLVPLLCAPLLRHMIGAHKNRLSLSDFPAHHAFAAQMRHEGRLLLPHPLFHLSLLSVQQGVEWASGESAAGDALPPLGGVRVGADPALLIPLNRHYAAASLITTVGYQLLLAAVLWTQLRSAARIGSGAARSDRLATLACVGLILALLAASHLRLRLGSDSHYYLGYLGINIWHNPTVTVAKPFSLIVFLQAASALAAAPRAAPAPLAALGAAFAVALCALAKPSYLLCILPAAALLALLRLRSGRPVQWGLLLSGIGLPTVAMLAWQYQFMYAEGSASGVEFAPFAVMGRLSQHLGPKFLLSIAFPAVCYLVWLPDSRRSLRLNLAWLAFGVGVGFAYGAAETRYATDGNFLWGAQIGLFILFAESTRFVVAALRSPERLTPVRRSASRTRVAICAILFSLHLAAGLRYYQHLMQRPASSEAHYY